MKWEGHRPAMIRTLISAVLRFHQAYIFQKMHPQGLSSAFASLSVLKEYFFFSPPEQIEIAMHDSKMGIKIKAILILLYL